MRFALIPIILLQIPSCPPPNPNPSPSPSIPPITTTTTIPTTTTTTTTTTTLMPEPTPTPNFVWKETSDNDNCPLGGNPEFINQVNWAVDMAASDGKISFPWTHGEEALYSQLVPYLSSVGVFSALYGEELAAAKFTDHSENYDLLLSNGERRTGSGVFRSRCTPATRSKPLQAPQCPFSRAEFLESGKWQALKVSQGAGNRKNADATPVVCNPGKCDAIGFIGRTCCPNGKEDNPNQGSCNVQMSFPVWAISSGTFCAAGGENGLADNPLRNCMLGSGKITVCSEGTSICKEENF